MKISTILDKVDEKQLFVPAFQREYVWKREDAKQLIDSLIKEYPTGTMLTWETANPPELKGPHKYDHRQGAVRILLDGQQRVTTLYLLIRGEVPPYYKLADITNDTRGLFVNLETLELAYYMKTRMENNPLWQDVTAILQKKVRAKDVVHILEQKGEKVDRKRDDLIDDNTRAIESILDREFPEQTVPIKASVREAIDIFYKVNASGVALTDAELALAQISGYWPQARDLFKAKLAKLETNGFVFGLDFLVYVLLGCLYHMGSDMRKLHGEENIKQLKAAWKRLDENVLDYVVNLLRTSAYVDHSAEISSVYALIPIIVYVFDKNGVHPSDDECRRMVKWFYYSQIRNRYVSQLPQKLDRDLRALAESHQPFDDLLAVIEEERRLEIQPDEFAGRAIQHPLFSMIRWYFKSRGAICFTTGVGLRKNMGRKYQLENDHIFPYSKLRKAGYGKGNRVKYAMAQELTNRAILTQIANRSKQDKNADDYLRGVQKRFPKALDLQCVPDKPALWKIERYEDFLRERRRMLATQLNTFLSSLTESGPTTVAATLEEQIAEGETDELEFKSSLRWDMTSGVVNPKLEDMIVKTIAAFGNGQGGTLLVGVGDDATILGLEHDYMALSGDRDEFEVHLRNMLSQALGKTFVATKLEVTFPQVGGQEICQIEIAAASSPLVVKVKDKNGQPIERFYLRSGNTSQELPMSEIHSYVKERFR